MTLPAAGRHLLGPGPSPVSSRILRAMGSPLLGHLDPDLLSLMDGIRDRLAPVFRADGGVRTLAVSGTGTAGLEAAVANIVGDRTPVLAVVTGYFGDRLAQVCERYGASVARLEVEWGRACDPEAVRRALRARGAALVAVVHAETSTGVVNPVEAISHIARDHGALTLVDAVTSLGAQPLEFAGWDLDVCYSCTQKGLGAPPGLAPLAVSPRALDHRTPSRSYYLDLDLLEGYWIGRKYHHTISAPLLYALHEALVAVLEEGLEPRWARHRRHHEALVAGLAAMGLELLPPPAERLWSLNAVRVPEGVDEAAVRRHLLHEANIEIGAGLGPLAGRIWRVGLMGHGSSAEIVLLFVAAFERALRAVGCSVPAGAGLTATQEALESASR